MERLGREQGVLGRTLRDQQAFASHRQEGPSSSTSRAREHGWETTLDAEYLAVTQLQADAFVTIDEAMAAQAASVVPVAPVSVLTAN